jgi:imidazolonepropionase-like amidohydrolase
MPGLIDCHVHAIHSEVNVRFLEAMPLTLIAARAATRLRAMLDRGFTTVRDTGGADWGIKTAIETGHIVGPRLYIAGQSIGPTGGHSDSRRRTNWGGECVCCNGLQFKSAIADGTDEVRKAAREQMRQGADHVKIMMSGGVASPYDPLDSLQFSEDEISAAVEEATAFGRYVCAHAYSAAAISRAARLGVRTIEHGNLIDDASAKLMAEKGMYLVANLVTYYSMKERAAQWGMIGESLAKNEIVLQGGVEVAEDLQAPRHSSRLWQRSSGRVALGPVEGVHDPAGSRLAYRDHPFGDDDRRRGPAHAGQTGHLAVRCLCRRHHRRRRPAERPCAAG